MEHVVTVSFRNALDGGRDPVERTHHSVRQKNTEYCKKDHDNSDHGSSYSIDHIHGILDTVCRHSSQHDARNFSRSRITDRRGHLNIAVSAVKITAALSFHAADYIFRDIRLPLVETVCILDDS